MRSKLIVSCLVIAFGCLSLLTNACQTSMSAKTEPYADTPVLAWDQILTVLQTGRVNLQNLSPEDAKFLEHSLLPMIKNRQWAQLTYIIERLNHSPSDAAHILSLHLRSQLAFEQKDYDTVESTCLEMLKLNPDNDSAKLALGLIYLYGGQFAKAVPYLNDAKPNPKAVAGLISAQRQLGDNDMVDALCEKYQSKEAELWEISYNCSLFEAQNMEAPEKALKILNASLSGQPADSEASRQLRSAITQIEVARTQNPKDTEAM